MRTLLALLLAPAILTAQEKKEKPFVPIEEIKLERKEPITYDKDIEPIFSEKCFVCHSGSVVESKFDMGTYAGVMKGGKRGAVVVAGKSAESFLYRSSGHREKPVMPLKGDDPLTPGELALLKLWIDQGAKAPTAAREKKVVALTLPPEIVRPVRSLAVSSGKQLIAVGRANRVHLYEASKFAYVKSLVDIELKRPDGKSADAAHISLVDALAFSPDGRMLASGSFREVFLWDVETGKLTRRIPGFADRITALAYSPDGRYFATGGGAPAEDGEVKLFAADGTPIVDIKNAHSDTVFGLQFSPDGTKIATCGADKFVKVFEVPSGKFLKSFEGHTHHVMDVSWKGDGKVLASAGADMSIKIWDYEKGEQIKTIATAHGKAITRLAFVGKTATFLTAAGDGSVKLWNSDGGNNVRTYGGNGDYLYALSIGEDGKLFADGGEEGIARVYTLVSNKSAGTLVPPGEVAKPKN